MVQSAFASALESRVVLHQASDTVTRKAPVDGVVGVRTSIVQKWTVGLPTTTLRHGSGIGFDQDRFRVRHAAAIVPSTECDL
jgi:hypothetical protein